MIFIALLFLTGGLMVGYITGYVVGYDTAKEE